MPPQLAWWASSLQLSGLSAGQAEVARQFLARATQLDPALRYQMAYRIAGDVVAHIAPPPPPGTPPQLVLAAVLAERHRRELVRLRPTMGPMMPQGAPGPYPPQPQPGPWPAPQPWPQQYAPQQAVAWPEPAQQPGSGGFSPPR
jgi:hypothetical protein